MQKESCVFCSSESACTKFRTFRFSTHLGSFSLPALLLIFLVTPVRGLDADVQTPQVGDHALRILSPNLLELFLVNTKQPDPARVNLWNWVDNQQNFASPDASSIRVIINGQTNTVSGIGFKRRPL